MAMLHVSKLPLDISRNSRSLLRSSASRRLASSLLAANMSHHQHHKSNITTTHTWSCRCIKKIHMWWWWHDKYCKIVVMWPCEGVWRCFIISYTYKEWASSVQTGPSSGMCQYLGGWCKLCHHCWCSNVNMFSGSNSQQEPPVVEQRTQGEYIDYCTF